MIDIHAHVFNVRSLPVCGILKSRGMPTPIAALVAAAIRVMAADDRSLDEGGRHNQIQADASVLSERAAGEMSPSDAVHRFVEQCPESLLIDDACDAALGLRGVQTAGDVIEQRRRALEDALNGTGRGGERFARWIAFFTALLGTERALVRTLQEISPELELAIHHMMDMERSYADCPDYDYVRQISRMRALAAECAGRLIGFVAFEPFRPGALRIVREAIEQGFCGVKFYPPSGYRPIGNVKTKISTLDPRVIDKRNLDFFTFCAEQDIPILAHCTPGGMERIPGVTGRFSDPDNWRTVLSHERFRSLRVCLGHAGGEAWIAATPEEGGDDNAFWRSYAGRVVRLCNDFPNVYCDISHLVEIVDRDAGRRFVYWYSLALRRFPAVAAKIMYGSDFPMINEHGRWSEYAPAMRAVFQETPALKKYERSFFRDNALAFLNLPRFIERSRESLTTAEIEHFESVLSGRAREEAGVTGVTPRPEPRIRVESQPLGMSPESPVDCLVLGAGIAGAVAAHDLMTGIAAGGSRAGRGEGRPALLIDGAGRIGGRIQTLRDRFGFPVEVGAELIHRPEPPTSGVGDPLERFWEDVRLMGLTHLPIDKITNGAISALIYFDRWSDDGAIKLRPGCQACDDRRFKAGLDCLAAADTFDESRDMSVAEFIESYICRRRGYCEADDIARATADYLLTGTVPGDSSAMSAASVRFDRVKAQAHSREEYHVAEGYASLPEALVRSADVASVLDAKITAIRSGTDATGPWVEVRAADGRRFFGKTAISTFSVGMLKGGGIEFDPPLPPRKREALVQIDSGPESKIVLRFRERFWPETMAILSNPGVTRRGGRSYFVPGYGRLRGRDSAVLTAFLTRNDAARLDELMPEGGLADQNTASNEIRRFIQDRVLHDLQEVFADALQQRPSIGPELDLDRDVVDFVCRSWAKDAFALGATSFVRHTGAATEDVRWIRHVLADAIPTQPLFWAGEATALTTQPWSVHGAHSSGVRAAREVEIYLRSLRL